MVNTKVDQFNEKDAQHYIRPAMVVIRRPFVTEGVRYRILSTLIKNGATASTLEGLYKTELIKEAKKVQKDYQEFFDNGLIFTIPTNFDDSTLDFDSILQGFFIISKSIPLKKIATATGSYTLVPDIAYNDGDLNKGANNLYSVEDVQSIEINKTSLGSSTARIVINNSQEKYTLTQQAFEYGNINNVGLIGDTVFRPNDEVSIFLPDLENNLQIVFRGLISAISMINQGGFNTISLDCEDFIKNLRLSRINASPSTDVDEAEGIISVFNPAWLMKKPHDIIPYILCRALTNYRVRVDSNTVSYIISYITDMQAKRFEQAEATLQKLLEEQYIDYEVEGKLISSTEVQTKVQAGKSVTITGYYNTNSGNKKQSAFVFTGTGQPLYQFQWANKGWDFYLSEWKTSLEVLNGMITTLNYMFYSTSDGVVMIKPPDITLRQLNDTEGLKGITNTNSSFYLKNNRVKVYSNILDDRELFNYIVIGGSFEEVAETPQGLYAVVGLQNYIDKYRIRMLKNQNYTGLRDTPACLAFGRAILDRQNKRVRSCSMDVIGDSKLGVDSYCYLENTNTLYYIERITHSYDVGGTFTTSIIGTWGRKPLFQYRRDDLLTDINDESINDVTTRVLKSLSDDKVIDDSQFSKLNDMIYHPSGRNELVSFLWFNNFVWEDISSLFYEDIINSKDAYLMDLTGALWKEILTLWNTLGTIKDKDSADYKKVEASYNTKLQTYKDQMRRKFGLINFPYYLPTTDKQEAVIKGKQVKQEKKNGK